MKLNKKRLLLAVSIIVLTALLVYLIGSRIQVNKYITQPIKRTTVTQIVEASGTINPVNTVSIGSTVSGLMKEVLVDYNSVVKAGQTIAIMDTSLFKADVEKSLATLKQLEAITYKDKQNYIRYKNLYNRNLVAKSEFEAAEATYKSDLAQIQQAKSIHEYNKYLLAFAHIKSPVDGIVISRLVDPGQPVAASFQAPELFLIAKDLKEMQIEVNISEADIGKVKENQDVEFTLDGYPEDIFNAKVSQIRISPTTVSNVVTYTVIVYVKNEDLKLKPGMTANVSIITQRKENVLCAPNIALKFSPDPNGEKYNTQGVWVLDGNKPKRVSVKTGANDDSCTEIISEEIKEGQKIIVDKKSSGKKSKNSQSKRPMRMF